MHPSINGLPTIVLMMPLAIVVGVSAAIVAARRAGISASAVARALALVVAVTLLGAKAMAVIEQRLAGDFSPVGLLTGFRYPGAIVAMLLAMPLFQRVLPARVGIASLLDVCACGIGAASAVMRVNCFLSGCCVGPPCRYPWCVAFTRGLPPELAVYDPVHPLQIYLMINSLVATAAAFRIMRTRTFDGQAFWTFLALHETGRAILEYWRAPRVPLLQAASLGLAVLGMVMLAVNATRRGSPSAIAAIGGRLGPWPWFGKRKARSGSTSTTEPFRAACSGRIRRA